ncbi:hypothetical protein [Spongiimicrobium sp. 3-5]|uniref:hypothetical protein n=1 Tax=Spongiimicrobium sp. 3-5 TaxID=3332596 RepID=UPI00397FC145
MKNLTFLFFTVFVSITNSILGQNDTFKDTLYFKYDDKYIETFKEQSGLYYIKESTYETFYFLESEILYGLRPKKVLNLKRFVRKSKSYDKNKGINLDEIRFGTDISKYIIFFIKKSAFIRVEAVVESI